MLSTADRCCALIYSCLQNTAACDRPGKTAMVGRVFVRAVAIRQSENAAFGQRLVEHGALDLAPLGDVASAYDDYVGGDAQPAQFATEPDRLPRGVAHLGLGHEEVEV